MGMGDPQEILSVLATAEGMVRELQRQTSLGGECAISILGLMEVRAALDRAGTMILDHYLDDCMADPASLAPQKLLRALELFFRMMPAPPPGENVLAPDGSSTPAAADGSD
jgi:DNA-binding FrmR family transcriptional regulator